MTVILRVDDFPGTKPEEFHNHNLENFKKFDNVILKHGLGSYVLGVIPKYLTDEHIDWLASRKHISVALHGIDHDERFPNEFRPFETQAGIRAKILGSVEKLRQSQAVTTYIPPHNVIDMRTALALKDAGFDTILCGPGTDTCVHDSINCDVENMWSIYSEFPYYYGRTDEMLAAGAPEYLVAHNSKNAFPIPVLTLHWTWEFNIGLHWLDNFLSKTSQIFL